MVKKINKNEKVTLISLLTIVLGVGGDFGIFELWAATNDVLAGTGIKLIAHRGYSDAYTENTLTAFRHAAEQPEYYGIETDVHVTSDGYLICNHDDEVHFADGTDMTIAENTLEKLRSKPVKSKFGADERVALFEEYLDACRDGGKRDYRNQVSAHKRLDKLCFECGR